MSSKRKRKRKAGGEDAEPSAPKAPGIATAIGPLLERAGLHKAPSQRTAQAGAGRAAPKKAGPVAAHATKPQPASAADPGEAALSPREFALLHQAYRDVEPIRRPKRARIERAGQRSAGVRGASEAADETAARARLSDLVGGGVRFEVTWDDGLVQGLRSRAQPRLLSRLSGSGFAPEAELDLHGLRRADVERAVSQFVRGEHRRGRRYLLVITGKGTHSEAGVGVLGEALVDALSGGSAAPLVLAFASAHPRHGGRGALAVMLE